MDTIKKRILLVRHGTTAYNETDRLQGRIDNPLLMENVARRWAVVDFWNSTSHLESAL
jgi:broad specificity phosphatase PhoE